MSFDNYKRVLFNDGEGLTFGDLNDAQAFLASSLFDSVVGKTVGGDPTLNNSVDPDSPAQFNSAHAFWAYALSVHAGQPIPGSANNKVKFSKGTVFQCIGADTGNEPVFVPYTFFGTEEFTIANGPGSPNNRIDIIQMQLAYVSDDVQSRDFEDATTRIVSTTSMSTKRRLQATISVKQGTPAVAAQFPDPDAGFCVLASVYVPTGYTGTGAMGYGTFDDPAGSATLMDQRIPLRIRPYTIYAKDGLYDPAIWQNKNGASVPVTFGPRSVKCNTNTTGNGNNLTLFCPKTLGRIMGISITSVNGVNTSLFARIGDLVEPDGFGAFPVNLASLLETGATMKTHFGGINILEAASSIVRSTNGIGWPMWCNGYGRIPEYFKIGSGNINHFDHAYIQFQPHSTTEIAQVTLFIAEGW